MIKYFAAFLSLFFFACKNAVPEKMDCSQFRTGKFMFHLDKSSGAYIIDRNDSIQTEQNAINGGTTRFKIKWISDCVYNLDYIDQHYTTADSMADALKTLTLQTRIVATGKDYYVFESNIIGGDKIFRDTIRTYRKHAHAETLH